MLSTDRFAINTFDKTALPVARRLGWGLEVEEYLWMYKEDEIAAKRRRVPEMVSGFSRLSFHGTAVSRDVVGVNNLSDEELLSIYNESYLNACFHGIDKIVYHSNYLSAMQTRDVWVSRQAAFWKEFLRDKPASLHLYIENFIDDTPGLLAQLCDSVDDPRLRICLDVGHASANSSIGLGEWVDLLGKRIGHVHLHNNDGLEDRHWSLGRGVVNIAATIESLLEKTDAPVFVLECDLEESLRWLYQRGFLVCPAGS